MWPKGAEREGQKLDDRNGRDPPSVLIFSSKKASSFFSVSTALVCWYRNVLLAEPPPLAINWAKARREASRLAGPIDAYSLLSDAPT